MTQVPRPPIELYDHEVDKIQGVWDRLRDRHQKATRNYNDVEAEIVGRFADAGFVAHVSWFRYEVDGVPQADAAMPEVTIVGRVEQHEFDHDKQVAEVTRNILGIPGQEGVIKTDLGGTYKNSRQGHSHDHAH